MGEVDGDKKFFTVTKEPDKNTIDKVCSLYRSAREYDSYEFSIKIIGLVIIIIIILSVITKALNIIDSILPYIIILFGMTITFIFILFCFLIYKYDIEDIKKIFRKK